MISSKLKNVTFSLPVDLIEKMRKYAKENYIDSMNAGVREALEEYIVNIEKKKLYTDMVEAAGDPLFMEDLHESMAAFSVSDAELAKEANEE
jgi:metal-responsive CopG/Arc/MetJ family transcriptional regulator